MDGRIKQIAEKVMGWHLSEDDEGYYWYDANNTPIVKATDDDALDPWLEHWNPLENIGDAWQVWQKLRESSKWCCLDLDSDYDICYVVRLTPAALHGELPHEPTVIVDEGIESAPLAICLAALKAVGVNTEEM